LHFPLEEESDASAEHTGLTALDTITGNVSQSINAAKGGFCYGYEGQTFGDRRGRKLSGIIVKSINGTEQTESQVDILESLAKDERVVAAMKDTFEDQESTAYKLGQKVADLEEMVQNGRPQVAPTDSQEGVTEAQSPSLPDGQMELVVN